MNLAFLNPLLLAGLAAAIIPVLIHRITRKKAVVRKFAAVRLLLQSQLISARPQRLKNLLLLALRIFALAAVVLMMARPVTVRPGFGALPDSGARVLILDNSLSMGFREEHGSRFELLKEAATAVLKDFGGRVALIPTVRSAANSDVRWLASAEALESIGVMPLSFGRGDVAVALTAAYRQLKDLKVPKQILVFSDLVRNDWDALDAARIGVIADAELHVFRIGAAGRDPNFCIRSVRLSGGEIAAGAPASLAVTVSNLSDRNGAAQVQLYLDGKKSDQKGIQLKSGADGSAEFALQLQSPGWVDGEVKLTADRLAADDTYYFALKVNEKAKVLVVDGDATASLRGSESYYLANALRPGGPEEASFLIRVISENELQRADLGSFDLLCLLNVADPDFSRAGAFLQAGKPVFVFLGDRVTPEAYNRFPQAAWGIRRRIDRSAAAAKTIGIIRIDSGLQFPPELENSLKSAVFYSYFGVEGAGKALLTLADGNPLLLAAGQGKSKLYLFTSSADIDWNDLPLKAAYVPLIQGVMKNAAGLTNTSLPAAISWGEPFDDASRSKRVRGAEGGPGIYQILRSDGDFRQPVNAPRDESNLVKLSADELKKKFGTADVRMTSYQKDSFENLQGGRREMWPFLLGLVLVILAVETVLADGLAPFRRAAIRKLEASAKEMNP